ncbi:beta-ketoacyl-ACP synthase II [Candidatus Haliotispira prima]|uniref:3-oxoacyl-[acyl-carrier-protein] synthase 2 n=1 Tax=Candidatus Haliotispira prima TaxID=3034016 RepID=A0ABY8MIX9_9SPIO|nr:beta-ketoacyl-ACP synthase II [Candidatus Haliotispira prima]
MNSRVVITGMGAVSPLGHNWEDSWRNMRKGVSGIGRLTRCNPDLFPSKVAAEVLGLDSSKYFDKKAIRKMARFTEFFCNAGAQAIEDGGLQNQDFYPDDEIAVIIGNGVGGFEVMEEAARMLERKGLIGIPPLSIPKLIINEGSSTLATMYGFHGPSYGVVTACASGTDAIGQALYAIKSGQIQAAVVGGAESALTELGIGAFTKLQTLSTGFNHEPHRASRPFDKDRDGFVMSEGAAVLILESLENARKRGARIYAELLGYGITCDAHHLTSPKEDGSYTAKAIQKALRMADIRPEEVDYLNAHGTSTPINDPTETRAIRLAFGSYADKLSVSSTKSMTGHMIGAAGAIELMACVNAIRDDFVPPTINLENPDPECDLDFVPNEGRNQKVNIAVSISLGFGGHNGCLVVKRFAE